MVRASYFTRFVFCLFGCCVFLVGYFVGILNRPYFDAASFDIPPVFRPETFKHIDAFSSTGLQVDASETSSVNFSLKTPIRIVCLVLTSSKFHFDRARAVKVTWGRRCSKLIFASDADDAELGAIRMGEDPSYEAVWDKVRQAFLYANEHFGTTYDWFLKADDDTYFVMENLIHAVSEYSPGEPWIMGRQVRNVASYSELQTKLLSFTNTALNWPVEYMAGGAGYVLSRKALELFVATDCSQAETNFEDLEMGKCLRRAGVRVAESRDDKGMQRFFPHRPVDVLNVLQYAQVGGLQWIIHHGIHPLVVGPACCSSTAISFHYISSTDMRAMDYLIYALHPADT